MTHDSDGLPWMPSGIYECQFDGEQCLRCELREPQNDCKHLWKRGSDATD